MRVVFERFLLEELYVGKTVGDTYFSLWIVSYILQLKQVKIFKKMKVQYENLRMQ